MTHPPRMRAVNYFRNHVIQQKNVLLRNYVPCFVFLFFLFWYLPPEKSLFVLHYDDFVNKRQIFLPNDIVTIQGRILLAKNNKKKIKMAS